MDVNVRDAFITLWERIGAKTDPAREFQRLVDRYEYPRRFYHTLGGHIAYGLGLLAEAQSATGHDDRALVAWFYHDAIQEHSCGAMNECHSAALCGWSLRLAKLDEDFIRDVAATIKLSDHKGIPTTPNAMAVLDTDLAILGAPDEAFDLYETGIRAEYAHVPEATFRDRRAELLTRFLNRKPLYWTDYFRVRFDAQARANLARSVERLHTS